MELRHLRYFVAVAEVLNFTKAAGKLHLAQPSLTRQIRDLEEEISVRLLNRSKSVRIAPRGAPKLSDEVVNKFVVEGKVPALKADKPSDLPLIEALLVTGADLFKTLAVSTTFTLLNSFGFQFGVGTAARLSRFINFGKLWMIWQILAGSSEGSGIRLPHLLNAERLRTVLTHRH